MAAVFKNAVFNEGSSNGKVVDFVSVDIDVGNEGFVLGIACEERSVLDKVALRIGEWKIAGEENTAEFGIAFVDNFNAPGSDSFIE